MTSTSLSPHSAGGAPPPDEFLPANSLCRELRRLTGRPCPTTARGLIRLAADDRLPLVQHGHARWWGCWRSRLPELAEALGMLASEPPPLATADSHQRGDAPEPLPRPSSSNRRSAEK